MRSVRCDACGARALIAASQCPACSHLFEVRDGFGDLLPLAHCPSCDSFYPQRVGSCRWCGTIAPPPPKHPLLWKRAGITALAAAAVVLVVMTTSRPIPARHEGRAATRAKPEPAPMILSEVAPAAPLGDTTAPRIATLGPTSIASTDTIATAAPPVAVAQPATASLVPSPPPKVVPSAAPMAPTSSRWINSIARRWVVVRADARPDARIVASVGPDSHVQLGELRGSWRRIKSRGIVGWVEARSSFITVKTPRTSRVLLGSSARAK